MPSDTDNLSPFNTRMHYQRDVAIKNEKKHTHKDKVLLNISYS